MKRYIDFESATMFVAKADDISAVCKALRRHNRRCNRRGLINTAPWALYTEPPKFRENGTYGLLVMDGYWRVLNADHALALIVDGYFVEAA